MSMPKFKQASVMRRCETWTLLIAPRILCAAGLQISCLFEIYFVNRYSDWFVLWAVSQRNYWKTFVFDLSSGGSFQRLVWNHVNTGRSKLPSYHARKDQWFLQLFRIGQSESVCVLFPKSRFSMWFTYIFTYIAMYDLMSLWYLVHDWLTTSYLGVTAISKRLSLGLLTTWSNEGPVN